MAPATLSHLRPFYVHIDQTSSIDPNESFFIQTFSWKINEFLLYTWSRHRCTPKISSRRHSVCAVSLLKSNNSKYTHDKKSKYFCGVTKTPRYDILTNWSIPTAPLKSRCNSALLRCFSCCSSFTWTCN